MSGNTAPPPTLITGIARIAGAYDVILSDIWGVIHNGREHFAEACKALATFRANGGTVILITNAPRPSPPVLKQLAGLKVPNETFDALVTSGDVTLNFIAERGTAPVYHIGPPRDLTLFDVLEQQTGLRPPLTPLSEARYVVCTGLFDDDGQPSDYDGDFALMRERGMDMISANPDIIVHVGDHQVWCAGALAQRYQQGGGKVYQAGKPFAPIYDRALALAQAKRGSPVDLKRVLAIGDGIGTDIKGATTRGLDVIFVTSGIHREDLHGAQSSEAPDMTTLTRLLAAEGLKPIASMSKLVW
jgi:HAD superfamily hydrolase (TIGR01459 family)